jgi:ABC-type phosphate/phosphonate transport system substrate-binding protein
MILLKIGSLAASVASWAAFVAVTSVAHGDEKADDPVPIGISRSLFMGTPDRLVLAVMQPFDHLLASQIGRSGKLIPADPQPLGTLLAENKVQLGIFQGIEFAWAQQRCPDLRPLVIAINQDSHLQAYVVVRADSGVRHLADLGGKDIGMARVSHAHCRLFLNRLLQNVRKDSQPRLHRSGTAEEILDNVADGTLAGAVVEHVAMKCFHRRKPARCGQLRVIDQSEVFPASVVAYRRGSIDGFSLKRYEECLENTANLTVARQMLTFWNLTSFESVPSDYDAIVANILKVYRPPAELTHHIASDQKKGKPLEIGALCR